MAGTKRRSADVPFPSRLREARTRAGVTAVRAAKALGIRRAAIHEMESGTRRVGAEELFRLAELYHVSPSWLMERKPGHAQDDRAELAAQRLAHLTASQLERLLDAITIVQERRSPVLNMPDWQAQRRPSGTRCSRPCIASALSFGNGCG